MQVEFLMQRKRALGTGRFARINLYLVIPFSQSMDNRPKNHRQHLGWTIKEGPLNCRVPLFQCNYIIIWLSVSFVFNTLTRGKGPLWWLTWLLWANSRLDTQLYNFRAVIALRTVPFIITRYFKNHSTIFKLRWRSSRAVKEDAKELSGRYNSGLYSPFRPLLLFPATNERPETGTTLIQELSFFFLLPNPIPQAATTNGNLSASSLCAMRKCIHAPPDNPD